MIIKKHWTSYVFPSILILLGLFCFIFLKYFFLLKYGGAVMFFVGLYQFFSKRDVEWSVNNNSISIWGFGTDFQIPVSDVYECFLEGGDIVLRRNDGLNTTFTETNLENALSFSQEVNRMVQNYKKTKNTTNVINHIINPSSNITDEIIKLNELREKGIISEDEFQELKNKIMKQ